MNKFFKCSCHSHMLEIEKDEEFFNFTIWEMGYSKKLSFFERIRWVWHVLKTGKPWADHVMLTREQIKEMGEFLKDRVIVDEQAELNRYKEYIKSLPFIKSAYDVDDNII